MKQNWNFFPLLIDHSISLYKKNDSFNNPLIDFFLFSFENLNRLKVTILYLKKLLYVM